MDVNIFDFDGVLADSLDAHFRFYRDIGKEMGIEVRRENFERALNETDNFWGYLGFSSDSDIVEKIYLEKFKNYNVPIFSGVENMLICLKNAGKHLCIASYNCRENVERVGGKILHFFDLIKTREDGRKSTGIGQIVDFFGSENSFRLIGDSYWDYDASRETGIDFLGVGYEGAWHKFRKGKEKFDVVNSLEEMKNYLLDNKSKV